MTAISNSNPISLGLVQEYQNALSTGKVNEEKILELRMKFTESKSLKPIETRQYTYNLKLFSIATNLSIQYIYQKYHQLMHGRHDDNSVLFKAPIEIFVKINSNSVQLFNDSLDNLAKINKQTDNIIYQSHMDKHNKKQMKKLSKDPLDEVVDECIIS